jgi:hypothetical protein
MSSLVFRRLTGLSILMIFCLAAIGALIAHETIHFARASGVVTDDTGEVSTPQALAALHRSATYPFVRSASSGRVLVAWTGSSGGAHQVDLCRGRITSN